MTLPLFPEFKVLNLEDKEEYNRLCASYPPISDISFTTLQIWWNFENNLSVSSFNGNLVISYNAPFDEINSGLGLVGTNFIDETVKSLFEYLKAQGRPVKLVHIPEFVVLEMKDKDGLQITEELHYHEYIMSSADLAALDKPEHSRTRRKVKRFLRETRNKALEVKSLDLGNETNRELIINSVNEWQKSQPAGNDPDGTEAHAIKTSLIHHGPMEMKNLCLFIEGRLQAVALYHQPWDKSYYIINHLKVDYGFPHIFDYMTQVLAKDAQAHGAPFMNMEMDLGIDGLRRHKTGLRPVGFFKKFTVTPAGNSSSSGHQLAAKHLHRQAMASKRAIV